MKYYINGNEIIINDKEEFNSKHILECGQIFSYLKENDKYIVLSKDKMAIIEEDESQVIIKTDDIAYFVNFFDLDNDYTAIKNRLLKNYPYLKKSIDFGYGIRILKQDIFETIISFILSSNNNIKRIQKILFEIRKKFGNEIAPNIYSFPDVITLSNASEEDFKNMGAGYRAKYLVNACKQLANVDLNSLKDKSTAEVNEFLLSIMGVGQKVADCILLFGYSKKDVFPVDTWIEKVYCEYFKQETDRNKIRKLLLEEFKEDSGYAQQYLFYSQRLN